MNYLIHLHLSPNQKYYQLGSLLGDFVKGPTDRITNSLLQQGIILHRKLDSFAEGEPNFKASKDRISLEYRRYAGILIDLFYDHFLAKHWNFFNACSLQTFSEKIYQMLRGEENSLPPRLLKILPIMIKENWLVSYQDINFVVDVVDRMSSRLKRSDAMIGGGTELQKRYKEFEKDFFLFLPEAKLFCDSFFLESHKNQKTSKTSLK